MSQIDDWPWYVRDAYLKQQLYERRLAVQLDLLEEVTDEDTSRSAASGTHGDGRRAVLPGSPAQAARPRLRRIKAPRP